MAKGFGKESLKKTIKSKTILYTELIEQALIAQKNKNFEKAEKIYQELIRLKVKNNIVYFNYGLLLESVKNIKKAKELYYKAIEYFPKDPNFYNKLALLNKSQGNFQEAVNLFIKAIQIDKSFENGYVNLANLYVVLKKIKMLKKYIDKLSRSILILN